MGRWTIQYLNIKAKSIKSCQLSNSVDQEFPNIKYQHICNNTSLVTQIKKAANIFTFYRNQSSCQLSSIVEKGWSQHGSMEIRSGFNNPQDLYPVM